MHNLYPVSGDICSNTRLDGNCIRGYNTETFTSVGTYSQCVQRCLTETRFLCRSVDYGYGSYTCYISLANKIGTGLDTSCFAYHYGRCLFNSAGISTILFHNYFRKCYNGTNGLKYFSLCVVAYICISLT